MSNISSLGQMFREDLTENLLVSVGAVVFAVIALIIWASLGAPSVVLYGLALPIAVFVPRIYEQYWADTHSRGFRIGWTVLGSLVTTATFLIVYEAVHLFLSIEIAGLLAIIVTPLGQFAIARLFKGQRYSS